jgi:transcriptional regulator with XRE-family HTH domain
MEHYMNSDSGTINDIIIRIGASVKGRRIQKELSQIDLAKKSGVSRTSIARFETGAGNISLQNLLLLMKVLDMIEELKKLFRAPEISPSMLAKATTKKMRSRVRKSKKTIEKKVWIWGDEK